MQTLSKVLASTGTINQKTLISHQIPSRNHGDIGVVQIPTTVAVIMMIPRVHRMTLFAERTRRIAPVVAPGRTGREMPDHEYVHPGRLQCIMHHACPQWFSRPWKWELTNLDGNLK
jgi:hypothetical protein